MNPYSQSLDMVRIQRDLRRTARRRALARAWSRWGDPVLAGALLALVAWAIVGSQTARPAGGTSALVAESRSPAVNDEAVLARVDGPVRE